jgi:hypothetical protein
VSSTTADQAARRKLQLARPTLFAVDYPCASLVGVADRVAATGAPEGLPAGKRTRYRLMELAYAGVEGVLIHKHSQRPYPKASIRKS